MRAQTAARGMADMIIMWGELAISNNWSGWVPGRELPRATLGFVVLSDVGDLPWGGDMGQRGGIYTWDHKMEWVLKADYLLLTFSYACRKERD